VCENKKSQIPHSRVIFQTLVSSVAQDSRPRPRIDTKTQDQFQDLTPRLKTKTKTSKKPRNFLVPRPRPRFFQKILFICKNFFFKNSLFSRVQKVEE
jgi:hypothetical protein